MSARVPVVEDDASPADLGDEPEGFWDAANAQLDAWRVKYIEAQEDDGAG